MQILKITPFQQRTPNLYDGGRNLSSPLMNGVWDFKLNVYAGVGTDGFIKKESHSYEWVVRLKQEGEKLTGDLIGGRGSRGEHVCADADISGSVREAKVNFVVTYQGSCCSQEQMKFAGEISDDGKSLTGKIEPVDVQRLIRAVWHMRIQQLPNGKRAV